MFDMLVRAIDKAGSTDPLKVALALEGMEQKDMFGVDNIMRKDDHQLLQPVLRGGVHQGPEIRRREDRPGLEDRVQDDGGRRDPADHLQDEAAIVVVGAAPADEDIMQVGLISLLDGLVYGMLLFMLASGLTLILSMMGVLNFAHASIYMLGAYFAYQISRWVGFWPALMLRRCSAARSAPRSRYGGCGASITTGISPNCCSPSVWCSSSAEPCR